MPEDGENECGGNRRREEARYGLDVDEELRVAERADDRDPRHREENEDDHEAPAKEVLSGLSLLIAKDHCTADLLFG